MEKTSLKILYLVIINVSVVIHDHATLADKLGK